MVGGFCLYIGPKGMTWPDAQQFCQTINGNLVEIDTAQKNTAIASEIREIQKTFAIPGFWNGLTDAVSEGVWRWVSTGRTPTYTSWRSGEPNNVDNEDCAIITDGWNDQPCSNPAFYPICEPQPCPSPYKNFEGLCLYFDASPLNWIGARNFCSNNDGRLVEIDSEDENRVMRDYLNQTTRCCSWIGLTDAGSEGVWRWTSTGLSPAYTNWGSGEPNNHGGNENCVNINGQRYGLWNDDHCSKAWYPICEYDTSAGKLFVIDTK